jgi:biotin carboxyl carrier protein
MVFLPACVSLLRGEAPRRAREARALPFFQTHNPVNNMIKKLRVTVDGKHYDVTVEMPEGGEAVFPPASAVPSAAPPAPPPIAPPPPVAVPVAAPAPTAAPATPSQPRETGGGPGAVLSPLAGRVTAIVASVNQEVKQGDHVLTLEAMKMNTFVFAPKAGKVVSIHVAVGDAVNEGDVLAKVD